MKPNPDTKYMSRFFKWSHFVSGKHKTLQTSGWQTILQELDRKECVYLTGFGVCFFFWHNKQQGLTLFDWIGYHFQHKIKPCGITKSFQGSSVLFAHVRM